MSEADRIIYIVLSYYKKTMDVITKNRKPENVRILHLLWYLLHKHLEFSMAEIARTFERDRSTVSYAVNHYKDSLKNKDTDYKDVSQEIERLEQFIAHPETAFFHYKMSLIKEELEGILAFMDKIENKELSN